MCPLLFFVVLAGCYIEQEQLLGACQLETGGKIYSTDPEIQDKEKSDAIELCMRARGYELLEESCPTDIRSSPIVPRSSASYEEIGKKLVSALKAIQRIEPLCYEPTGSIGKRLLWLERTIGTAPRS
jgi:hypothetical protein